jgi:hypothetical protein
MASLEAHIDRILAEAGCLTAVEITLRLNAEFSSNPYTITEVVACADIPLFTATIVASNLRVRRAGQDMRLPDAAQPNSPQSQQSRPSRFLSVSLDPVLVPELTFEMHARRDSEFHAMWLHGTTPSQSRILPCIVRPQRVSSRAIQAAAKPGGNWNWCETVHLTRR